MVHDFEHIDKKSVASIHVYPDGSFDQDFCGWGFAVLAKTTFNTFAFVGALGGKVALPGEPDHMGATVCNSAISEYSAVI